jgi:pimeloyl-ACP methyl ester carboxylesterase
LVDGFVVEAGDGTRLEAVRVGADPVTLVFLHAGVCDRRSWSPVMDLLADRYGSIAYDRPGFGTTAPATTPYTAIEHLHAVTAAAGGREVVLVGNSQGGRIAIDYALAEPGRVRGLVLVASALSGGEPVDWEAELGRELLQAIEAAEESGDLDAVNRYEARVWLDGPRAAEGRVSGPVRDLFLAMNGVALRHGDQAPEVEPSPAVDRLSELAMPVLMVTGALDVAAVGARCRAIARAVRGGRHVEIPDAAHLPALEHPDRFVDALIPFLDAI